MNQIDHDPHEPDIDRSNWPWWVGLVVFSSIFAINWYFGHIDFMSLVFGIGIGGALAGWAIEKTGNKIPDSWRMKR